MKKLFFICSLSACIAALSLPIYAQNAIEKAVGAMHWLDTGYTTGSACVMTTIAGKTVYFDPVMDKLPKLPDGRSWPKADIIFWTHSHQDHYSFNAINALRKPGTKFYATEEITYKIEELEIPGGVTVEPDKDYREGSISIHTVPMYTEADEKIHSRRMGWVGYIVKAGGVTLLVTGDSGLTPEMRAVTGVDILLVNVLANYMMTVSEAAEFARILKPKVCIPIHWNGSYETEAATMGSMMPEGIMLKYLPLEQGVANR